MTFKSKLMLNTSSRIAQSKHMNSLFQDILHNIKHQKDFFFIMFTKSKKMSMNGKHNKHARISTLQHMYGKLKKKLLFHPPT
jgi:hypothetical protein